jgi:ribosomal protein S18 acetylase RimI-like enzyme
MNPHAPINVRPATEADLDFMLSLLPRFAETAPPWRTEHEVVNRVSRELRASMAEGKDFAAIAENQQGEPLGFIRLSVKFDFLTEAPYGYVEELVVSRQAQGQGAAHALLKVAQDWARALKLEMLGLHVLAGNTRARQLYERLGYQPEAVKYVKLLGEDAHD